MIETSAHIALLILVISAFISFIRLFRGKSLPDRIVALNMIGTIAMGIALLFIFTSGKTIYLDVAGAAIVIVFAGTVMIARYLKRKVYDK